MFIVFKLSLEDRTMPFHSRLFILPLIASTTWIASIGGIAHGADFQFRDRAVPDDGESLRTSDYSINRRAAVLLSRQMRASATIETQSGSALGSHFAQGVTARAGIGTGISVELSAVKQLSEMEMRPGAGIQWQFAGREPDANLMAALFTRYRAEGFTEAGGEVETSLIGTLRRDRFEASLNGVGGVGIEGGEGDFEMNGDIGVYALSQLFAGLETRNRWSLGRDPKSSGLADHFVGPLVQYAFKQILVSGSVGLLASSQPNHSSSTGLATEWGLSYVF